MTINGMPIKKYKAKVKNPNHCFIADEEEYKTVIGYISIGSIVVPYGFDIKEPKPNYKYVFVSDEINWDKTAFSGMGRTVYTPTIYEDFEIIGEVEDDE